MLSSIGPTQWLIILVIIILLFGAKKIPELAKGLGRGIKTFKSEMADEEKLEEKNQFKEHNALKDEEKKA